MKSLIIDANGDVAAGSVPDPELSDDSVIVRVEACGLCQTDRELMTGGYGTGVRPMVPGHEYTGTLEAVGDNVEGFSAGDTVVVDPNIHCGTCRSCLRHEHQICDDLQAYGITHFGGFAELSSVSAENLVKIDGLSAPIAALAEPIGCVLNGLGAARKPVMENAMVFGAGPIGVMAGLALSEEGVESVTVVDIDDTRLRLAESLGLGVMHGGEDLEPFTHSVDFVLDATGNPGVVGRLPKLVASGGSMLVMGVCPQDATIAIEPYDLYRRQISIHGSHSLNHNIAESLDLIQRIGEAKLAPVVTDKLPLDDVVEHFINPGTSSTMKVQYVPA